MTKIATDLKLGIKCKGLKLIVFKILLKTMGKAFWAGG